MESKKYLIFGMLLTLVVVHILSFVHAEMLISDSGVKYEQKILDEFAKLENNNETNQTFVHVLIYLKDSLDADTLISSFSENEIKDITGLNDISPTRFSIKITKEGFDKLINDSRVEKIYYEVPIRAHDPKNKTKITLWLLFIFILITLLIVFYTIIRKIIIKNKKKR